MAIEGQSTADRLRPLLSAWNRAVTPRDPRAYDYPRSLIFPHQRDYDREDNNIPMEEDALYRSITAKERELGITPRTDLRPRRAEMDKDTGLDASVKYDQALSRRLGKGSPGAGRDKMEELTGETGPSRETLNPARVLTGSEYRREYEPRIATGKTASMKAAEAEAVSPATADPATADPAKPAQGKWSNERQTPEGILSSDERKFLMEKIRRDMLSGDQTDERGRRIYETGTGWAKSIVGAAGLTSSPQAYRNIIEGERHNLEEFDRPEAQRQGRLKSNLANLSADTGYAQEQDQAAKRTVGYNGQVIDPDVAARSPELFVDADMQSLREAGVDEGTIGVITSMKAQKFGSGMQKQGLEGQKVAAEIEKLKAEANKANVEAEKRAENPEELAIIKEQIWRGYQADVERLSQAEEDKWFTWSKPNPEDPEFLGKLKSRGELPFGYDLSNMGGGYKNYAVLEEQAREQKRAERTAAIKAILAAQQ